jgi:hypothetical protein
MHQSPPPWLFIVLPAVYFITVWCAVCLLVSFHGGWRQLAQRYPALHPPSGTRYSTQWGGVDFAHYHGFLTIHASPGGIFISVWPPFRLGHPPIFIPEDEIYKAKAHRRGGWDSVIFDVGSPCVATMQLSRKIFDDQRYPALLRC